MSDALSDERIAELKDWCTVPHDSRWVHVHTLNALLAERDALLKVANVADGLASLLKSGRFTGTQALRTQESDLVRVVDAWKASKAT